jgi:hypothetical protein
MGLSLPAAWLGAVTYVFSGVGVSEVVYTNHHAGTALLPWILWAMGRSDWPDPRRVIVLSLLLGLDFLAGDVFTVAIAILACAAELFFPLREGQARREGLILGASLGLGLLLALPQVVATAVWIPHTERAVTGFRVGEAVELSLSPWRLLEVFVPFPFGDTWQLEPNSVWATPVFSGRTSGFFSTLYAGAFAPIGVILCWRSAKARFARFLLVAGIALAISGKLVPAAARDMRSPLPFRHPEKFAVLIALGLALFAGLGWERLRKSEQVPRWSLGLGLVLAAVALWARFDPSGVAAAGVRLTGTSSQAASIASDRLGPALAEGALLWMVTVLVGGLAVRRSVASGAIALLLLTLIPILANRRIAPSFSEEDVFAPTAFTRAIQKADPDGAFRTLATPSSSTVDPAWAGQDVGEMEFWRRSWLYFTPTLWNRGTVFNQDADHGDLSRMASLRRVGTIASGFKDSGPFFGSLALRWNIRLRGEPSRAGYHRVGGDSLQDWDEHEKPYPDIRLLSSWQEVPTAVEALRALPRLRSGEVVLESGLAQTGAAPESSLRILERTPERLRLETESRAPTWLFVLRGYFPSRRVLIDEKPTEVVPAQLAFSAARIPGGRHLVEWSEELPGGRGVFAGPAAFVILAFASLAVRSRRGGLR